MRVLSVSQINFFIKSLIEGDGRMRDIYARGEISNFTDHYRSGHLYFSLKDEKSVLKAVMFSSAARRLRFHPKEGMRVIVRGRVAVYEPGGQYQFYVEEMQPDGVGARPLGLPAVHGEAALEERAGLLADDLVALTGQKLHQIKPDERFVFGNDHPRLLGGRVTHEITFLGFLSARVCRQSMTRGRCDAHAISVALCTSHPPGWRNGIRGRLKPVWAQARRGSNPLPGTAEITRSRPPATSWSCQPCASGYRQR